MACNNAKRLLSVPNYDGDGRCTIPRRARINLKRNPVGVETSFRKIAGREHTVSPTRFGHL